MLIAPYVLEGTATCDTEEIPNRWSRFQTDVAEKAEAVKRLGTKYNLPVVELQPVFDEACKRAPASYWTFDGVHPTACGHELITRKWLETFPQLEK